MAYTNPSVSDFKNYFTRDFAYGVDPDTSILDIDIANAYQLVNVNINQGLFTVQSNYNLGYLFLAAHFLTLNIRASSQGVNGQFNWLEKSKSTDKISSTFEIPERILNNPLFSMYTKSNYGMMYLQMLLPQLTGFMFPVLGAGLVPRYGQAGYGLNTYPWII